MSAPKRRTLARDTKRLEGKGLHGGRPCAARFRPAPAGTGLVFRLPGGPDLPARLESVISTDRCVALGRGKASVSTVEHALAACTLAGLDDAILEIEGGEVPAADGSALEFLGMIREAGLTELAGSRARLVLEKEATLAAQDGGAGIRAEPAAEPVLTFSFGKPACLKGREASFSPRRDDAETVARARTFCFEQDIKAILERGLGLGGDAGNCLVLRADGTSVNEARDPREPELHKLLDLIGDLTLCGAEVCAKITARDTGHAQNVALGRMITSGLNNRR